MLRDSINTIYISFNLLATYTSAYHTDGVILYKNLLLLLLLLLFLLLLLLLLLYGKLFWVWLFLCDFKFFSNLGWLIYLITHLCPDEIWSSNSKIKTWSIQAAVLLRDLSLFFFCFIDDNINITT